MEEGSFRCDANISVRKKGETKLGTRVEVKNLNSIRNVKRAVDFESKRLIDLVEKGETILQQTRSFDATNGTTLLSAIRKMRMTTGIFPILTSRPFIWRMTL